MQYQQPTPGQQPSGQQPKTFEEVDAHVNAVKLTALTAGATREQALTSLCPVWKAVLPIVNLALGFPLFPAKWKALLTTFVQTMAMVCP